MDGIQVDVVIPFGGRLELDNERMCKSALGHHLGQLLPRIRGLVRSFRGSVTHLQSLWGVIPAAGNLANVRLLCHCDALFLEPKEAVGDLSWGTVSALSAIPGAYMVEWELITLSASEVSQTYHVNLISARTGLELEQHDVCDCRRHEPPACLVIGRVEAAER